MDLKSVPKQKKEPAAAGRGKDFRERPIEETITGAGGNPFANAILAALRRRGISAKISRNGLMGYSISAETGKALISGIFKEDENEMDQIGAQIRVDGLRVKWFREGMQHALNCRNEKELYEVLTKGSFFSMPWSSNYHFRVDGEMHINGETLQKLKTVKIKNGAMPLEYEVRFADEFLSRLPKGFGIVSSDSPQLVPLNGDALKSMVEEDEAYKKAVDAVKEAANEIVKWK